MSRRGAAAQVSGALRRRQKAVSGAALSELQELRSRTEHAERRLLACESLVGQLGSGLAAMGTLLQGYGQLQQRLENVENLLKNRNFWILRFPPSSRGEIPKVPLTFDDVSVYFNELEWQRLERWQKDLYRAVMRGNYETLVSLDYAMSKPDILSQLEKDEELSDQEDQEPPQTRSGHSQEPPLAPEEMDQADETLGHEIPMDTGPGEDTAVSKPSSQSWIKRDEELCGKEGQESTWTHTGDSQKAPETQTGDSQKVPETQNGDSEKSPQIHTGDSQESPQTQTGDSQEAPQTGVPINQKPQQALEEIGQQEEALGEGPDPMESGPELPILVMNVVSLGDHRLGMETEEDVADPDMEEASLPEDEMLYLEASPENLEVKEEEPEVLPEDSTPSSSSEIQKCPKNESVRAKNKKKPNRCETSNLLMGNCRRGYVREWSHPCTECGKRFRLKINLIIHQRSHAKEGPYECPVCEIGFTDKRHLDLHRGIHVKDRAFGAKVWGNVHPELRIRPRRDLCGGAHGLGNGISAGGACLAQPKEEQDRGGLPGAAVARPPTPKLKCMHCKKMLSGSTSLQRHLRTHLRDRPHCCSSCDKCFTRRTHLLRHEMIHQRALAVLRQAGNAQPGAAIAPSRQHTAPEPERNIAKGNTSPAATKAGPPVGSDAPGAPGQGLPPSQRLRQSHTAENEGGD
ncbi:zinc finger protein 783-like [Pithys albifrons albifrons]|uniref:zinc finger protein 783-like n=1 Tax=Pithys albifrons albifrons TaxID=3385563 RepID=UPI003A5CB029